MHAQNGFMYSKRARHGAFRIIIASMPQDAIFNVYTHRVHMLFALFAFIEIKDHKIFSIFLGDDVKEFVVFTAFTLKNIKCRLQI